MQKILVIGGVTGIAHRVAKALVLAGLSVVMADAEKVQTGFKLGKIEHDTDVLWPHGHECNQPWYRRQRNGKPARY